MAADNLLQQEDEMAILEAMKTAETEFQWEYLNDTVVGVIRVEPSLQKPLTIQFDPESGIYKHISQTEHNSCSAISVSYLPSVELHFELPSNYPSEAPPKFTLSCQWLNFSQVK